MLGLVIAYFINKIQRRSRMKFYNIKKIAHSIIYFLDHDVQNLGITKLMKLCFYSDKYHLEKYGKPIFKHTYTKLERGPVPTWLYSIIRTSISGQADYDFEEEVNIFNQLIEVYPSGYKEMYLFKKKVDFDKKYFSKSQIEILDQVISEFKSCKADYISEKSHETRAWKSVNMNETIGYDLMVDNKEVSAYLSFINNEKRKFDENFSLHKLTTA